MNLSVILIYSDDLVFRHLDFKVIENNSNEDLKILENYFLEGRCPNKTEVSCFK